MAQINLSNKMLYNSPIEIGIRTLILLNEFDPIVLDLTQLIWFNHVVVHTKDFGGPESLHPKLEDRSGELVVLRALIQDGFAFFQRFGLVRMQNAEEGFCYAPTDDGTAFVSLLRTRYALDLMQKSKWVVNSFFPLGKKRIEEIIREKSNA